MEDGGVHFALRFLKGFKRHETLFKIIESKYLFCILALSLEKESIEKAT